MKLRTMAMVVFSVGMLAGAGCKKKPKEKPAPPEGSGSSTAGTGAAPGSNNMGSGSAEAPKEAKLEGKALADRYVECAGMLSTGKWDDFKSKCVAKDYKGHEADGEDIASLDALMEMFKTQSTAFPDMKIQPQLVFVNGRNILAVAMISGTHTGVLKSPMGEIPATNKKMGLLMFHRLAINDENRATEEWAWSDPATMVSQLGLMPKDGPKLRPAMEKAMDGAPVIIVAADDDKEKKNLDAVSKANAAFQTRKAADYMAFYTDDAIEADQAGDSDAKGKKAVQAGAEIFLKAFPDVKLEYSGSYAAGDYVVQTGSFSGTNDGPLGPMKPTKKKVTSSFAEVIKMKDGKMAEVWRFRNGMAMAAQLGLMGDGGKGDPGKAGSGDAPKAGSGDAPKKEDKKDAPKKDEPKKDDAKKSG